MCKDELETERNNRNQSWKRFGFGSIFANESSYSEYHKMSKHSLTCNWIPAAFNDKTRICIVGGVNLQTKLAETQRQILRPPRTSVYVTSGKTLGAQRAAGITGSTAQRLDNQRINNRATNMHRLFANQQAAQRQAASIRAQQLAQNHVTIRSYTRKNQVLNQRDLNRKIGAYQNHIKQHGGLYKVDNYVRPSSKNTNEYRQRALKMAEKLYGRDPQALASLKATIAKKQVDHIIDLQFGGSDTSRNMRFCDARVNGSLGSQMSWAMRKGGNNIGSIKIDH